MKLQSINDIEKFSALVDSCEGDVVLESPYGDRYNLKSKLSQYIGLAALVGKHADELELFCQMREDEERFIKFFDENPQILKG